jgi:AcrR family transcriptional regulator
MLLEAVVARRADRLIAEWREALAEAVGDGPPTVSEVLCAYWAPFATREATREGEWRNYLCAVAWLSQAHEGDAWWSQQFGGIERSFRDALGAALPGVPPDAIERGFRYSRDLLDAVLLHRCNKTGGHCRPAPTGLREDDVDGLIAFLAAGLEALPPAPASLHATRVCRTHLAGNADD